MNTKQFRDSLKQGFTKQHGQIEAAFKGMSAEQLAWRPDENSWSVGQCLYHMWLANDKYLANLGATLRDRKRTEPKDQDYSSSWFGARFIEMIGPTGGKNTPVPKPLVPHHDKVPRDVVQLLLDQLEAFQEFLDESQGTDLKKTRMRSPINKLVRLQLGDVFLALQQHNERHINQAVRISRISAFPGGARAGVS